MQTSTSLKAESVNSMGTGNLAQRARIEQVKGVEDQPAVYRKVLLRIVFWALGLAACFGAVGVIFAGHDTLWRIVGTCTATAVGAFLLLAASRQLDHEATWLPGVMMTSLLVTEYLGTLGLMLAELGAAAGYCTCPSASGRTKRRGSRLGRSRRKPFFP